MTAQRRPSDPPDADAVRLILRYQDTVHRVCRGQLTRREDIEDAEQETFARFLEADRSKIANPQAWFIAVAVRVCLRIHRVRYQRQEVSMFSDGFTELSGDDDKDCVLDSVWFSRLTRSLPVHQHRVLVWLYVDKLPPQDVARRLGVSTPTLRVIASRARQRARKVLQVLQDTPDWHVE